MEIEHTVLSYGKIIEKRDATKNNSSRRTLGLIPEVKDMLIELGAAREKNAILFGKEYEDADYIFTWPDGKLISLNYVTYTFKRVLEKCGLKK
jgi:hypothetical protein